MRIAAWGAAHADGAKDRVLQVAINIVMTPEEGALTAMEVPVEHNLSLAGCRGVGGAAWAV